MATADSQVCLLSSLSAAAGAAGPLWADLAEKSAPFLVQCILALLLPLDAV